MRISLLSVVPAAVLLGLAGCADRSDSPLGPPSPPLAAISDGAHRGNDHFFFLPPMVPNPNYHGTFDATLAPEVDICEWTGSGCLLPSVATFTTTTGPGSETIRVADGLYVVNWHTDRFPLDPGKVYRVRVAVAGTELGYADVSVVGSGREVKNVNTNEYIALVDGRTLPIKFRIEVGAVFVIGPDGGVANAADGQVRLVVPPGALAAAVGIVVRPAAAIDLPTDLGLVAGTVFDFQPSGLVFALPVSLTIAYDETNLPQGFPEAALTLLAEEADIWDELAGTSVDVTANTIAGSIDRFSRKGGARAASISVSPTAATLIIGETVSLAATVTDAAGNPVRRWVRWSSSDPLVATVDGAGLVTAVAAGTATITALAGGVPALAQVQVSAPSPGYWTYVAPMPTARGRLAAAVANGILYTVGGYWSGNGRNLEAYNPATNTWTVKVPMPTAREGMSAASVNGIVYVMGGAPSIYSPPLGTVEAYDPATNTWTTKAPMPTPRLYLAVAELNGKLYAVGGHRAGPIYYAAVEAYDPATDTWTTKAPMPTVRTGVGLAVVNGILYAVGGYSPSSPNWLGTVEAYDPVTNTWSTRAPMPTPRAYFAAGALNGVIYAAGGNALAGCGPGYSCAQLEAYNPVTNTWTSKPPLANGRYGTAGGVVGGLFYVTGGLYSPGSGTWALSSVEAYHP